MKFFSLFLEGHKSIYIFKDISFLEFFSHRMRQSIHSVFLASNGIIKKFMDSPMFRNTEDHI